MDPVPEWFTRSWLHCGLRVRFAEIIARPARWSRQRLAREDRVYLAVIEGRLRVRQGAWTTELAPGDQVIVASLHPFSTSAIDGPVRFLQLDFRMISTAPDQDLLPRVGLPAQVTARDRQRLFERCQFLHEHPPYGKLPAAIRLQSRPVAEQLITQYFLDGFETDAFAAGAQSVPEWLVQIRQHIAENFTGKIDLTALAQHSGFCRSHLNHEFRRVFGRSPMRLVLELRLGVAAQRLISNPDESIGQIATDCGFHSHSHFGRWFRQKYGISPSDWRQHKSPTPKRPKSHPSRQ